MNASDLVGKPLPLWVCIVAPGAAVHSVVRFNTLLDLAELVLALMPDTKIIASLADQGYPYESYTWKARVNASLRRSAFEYVTGVTS